MTKKYAWIILLLLTATLLAACSGNPPATPAAPASSTSTKPAAQSNPPTAAPANPSAGYPAQGGAATQPPAGAEGYPAQGSPTAQPPAAAGGYPAQGQGLAFTLPGGASKAVTLDNLIALATVNVNISGKDQPLRKLSDALSLAGAANYTKVTVTGQSGTLALTKDQVAQAYLDIQGNGAMRVVVQGIDPTQWPNGVTTIQVQ